jgi:ABC-2 type transport system ATP-binding protein
MRELIKELAENATVIISTHVLQEVQAICERVLIMRRGKLVLDSKINDLRNENQYIFTFQSLNTPIANLLSGFDGVKRIEKINGDEHSYNIEVEKKILPQLVKSIVSDGSSLETIIPQTRNLETVFAEVSTEGELN